MATPDREKTDDEASSQLGSNVKFCTRRNEHAKEREIELRGVPTRQHQIASIVLDRTSIQAIKQQSERGRHPTYWD